ncbi:hypothetical protein AAZX31_05G224000 [Glycine max]
MAILLVFRMTASELGNLNQHTNSLVPVDQNLKLISDFITAFGVWDFHMFQNIMTPQILNVVTAMSPLSTCGTARSTRSHFEILQEITLVSSIVLLVFVLLGPVIFIPLC